MKSMEAEKSKEKTNMSNVKYPAPPFKAYVVTEGLSVIEAYFDDERQYPRPVFPWDKDETEDAFGIMWDEFFETGISTKFDKVIAEFETLDEALEFSKTQFVRRNAMALVEHYSEMHKKRVEEIKRKAKEMK